MAGLQVQARALGDPTRHAIFEYLVDAGAPVDVAELTSHFRLHHNAIRQHLAKLVSAELVIQATAASGGRGRPRFHYLVDPSADSRWGATGPYERLAVLLTEVVRTGDSPAEVGRRAGLAHHRAVQEGALAGEGASREPIDVLVEQMARHGFEPTLHRRGDSLDVTLEACPFPSAVLTDPTTVCALHLGLAQGVAESVGGIMVTELIPKDPRQAHCMLRCQVSPVAPT